MSDRRGLESALREHPFDATTRLIYADWLEEHGHDTAAESQRQTAGMLSPDAGGEVTWDHPVAAWVLRQEREHFGRSESAESRYTPFLRVCPMPLTNVRWWICHPDTGLDDRTPVASDYLTYVLVRWMTEHSRDDEADDGLAPYGCHIFCHPNVYAELLMREMKR